MMRRSGEENLCGEGEAPVAGSTPNIQRPTPNFQSKQCFALGFCPWALGVGRWMLGVEMRPSFDAIALSKNPVAFMSGDQITLGIICNSTGSFDSFHSLRMT